MSIVNVDTAEINGVDGGTTVARFDGRIDRWINTRIGRDHTFLYFTTVRLTFFHTMGNDFQTAACLINGRIERWVNK